MWYNAIKMLEINHTRPPVTLGAEAVTTDVGTVDGEDEDEKVTTGVVVVGGGGLVLTGCSDEITSVLEAGVVVASTKTELV